jgi:hypothetical protein
VRSGGGVDPGLCAGCAHVQVVVSGRGSKFFRCLEHDRDPAWPKYPPLPVLRCGRFVAAEVSPPGGAG